MCYRYNMKQIVKAERFCWGCQKLTSQKLSDFQIESVDDSMRGVMAAQKSTCQVCGEKGQVSQLFRIYFAKRRS